ncbi:MAG: hypothetical protein KJ638_13090 [Chloroflexi bacterium]|nr:hypothetical protein [Chloroflexota bacterium]
MASQRVSESASRRVGESASQRVSESASRRVGESASRRVSESASQRVSESASRRVGESANDDASRLTLYPLSSVLYPLPSVLCPLSSALHESEAGFSFTPIHCTILPCPLSLKSYIFVNAGARKPKTHLPAGQD